MRLVEEFSEAVNLSNYYWSNWFCYFACLSIITNWAGTIWECIST